MLLEAVRMILEAVRVFVRKVEAFRVFWRSRVLLEVIIGILEPKRELVKAVSVCKGRESDCKVRESACKGRKSACRGC